MITTYQQMEYQALIDLLAEETQGYTKAFVSGNQSEIAKRGIIIAALIAEIKRRNNNASLPPTTISDIPLTDNFETAT